MCACGLVHMRPYHHRHHLRELCPPAKKGTTRDCCSYPRTLSSNFSAFCCSGSFRCWKGLYAGMYWQRTW